MSNADYPNAIEIIICIGIIILAVAISTYLSIFDFIETHNFNSTTASQHDNTIVLRGEDGNLYAVCDSYLVDAVNIPNTTVYSRVENGVRRIAMYEIPNITFVKPVLCW